MIRIRHSESWMRKGFSLLWSAECLQKICEASEVVSMRKFIEISMSWPDDLPSASGNALVVSGVEGCLDILSEKDSKKWLEHNLRERILSFQDHYEGQAALILWLPSGKKRISMLGASEEYYWRTESGSEKHGLHLGRLLWSGAENEVERIMNTEDTKADPDGIDWVGLHHPRIS